MDFSNLKEPANIPESILISEKVIPYLYSLGCEYLKREVQVSIGNSKTTADIVVYLDEEASKPYIVAEVKSNLLTELTLLDPAVQKIFTTAVALGASVRYLLVTNGIKYYWFERSSEGHSLLQLDEPPEIFQKAYQLPLFEEKLIPVTDPEQFLKIMESVIQVLSREGVVFGLRMATEINRILLAKLKDEEILQNSGQSIFTSRLLETEQIAQNIEYLYKLAIASLDNISIDKVSTKEGLWFLSPQALLSTVKLLEAYALSTVTTSIRGGFFWEAFSDYGKIEGGIHTTPIGLAELLIQLIQTQPQMRIIDPACGSGLFLIAASRQMENQRIQAQAQLTHLQAKLSSKENITGIEWNAEVAELATTNLALNRLSPSSIIHTNALDHQNLRYFGINTKSYDRVILDPPIGEALHDEHILQQYEIHHHTSKPTKEMLFIELAIKLLRPGGILAVLVPDSLLSSPSYLHARSWILKEAIPRAIISLPIGTFAPVGHSGKATLLLLEAGSPKEKMNDNVLLAEVKSIGYDKSGKAIDHSDLPELLETVKIFFQTGQVSINQTGERLNIWTIPMKNLDDKRLDVAQMNPSNRNILNLNRYPLVHLRDIVEIISGQNVREKGYIEKEKDAALVLQAGAVRDLTLDFSNVPYISSKDYKKTARAQVKIGDVLVTTTGQYLGRAAAVDRLPNNAVASGAVTILRPFSEVLIDSFFLAAVISSELGKKQIEQKQAAAVAQPYIRRQDLGTIQIPLPNLEKQKEIATRLREAIKTIEKLHHLAQRIEITTKKLVLSEILKGENNE